jgi:hypothetical protein
MPSAVSIAGERTKVLPGVPVARAWVGKSAKPPPLAKPRPRRRKAVRTPDASPCPGRIHPLDLVPDPPGIAEVCAFKCRLASSVRRIAEDLAQEFAGGPMKRERRQMTTTYDPQEPLMPFGKHRGKTVTEVLGQDPSYLAWFCDTVDGNETLKRAIRALPGFPEACGRRFGQKPPVRKPEQEPDLPNMGVDPRLSREDLDRLCREILHPPEEERPS